MRGVSLSPDANHRRCEGRGVGCRHGRRITPLPTAPARRQDPRRLRRPGRQRAGACVHLLANTFTCRASLTACYFAPAKDCCNDGRCLACRNTDGPLPVRPVDRCCLPTGAVPRLARLRRTSLGGIVGCVFPTLLDKDSARTRLACMGSETSCEASSSKGDGTKTAEACRLRQASPSRSWSWP